MSRRFLWMTSVVSVLAMLAPAPQGQAQDAPQAAVQVAQLSLTNPGEYRRREFVRYLLEEAERRRYLEGQAQQAREQEERNRQYQREQAEAYRRDQAMREQMENESRQTRLRQELEQQRREAESERWRLRTEIETLNYRLSLQRQHYYEPAPVYQPPIPHPWTPLPGMQSQPAQPAPVAPLAPAAPPRQAQPVVALSGSYPSPGAAFRDRNNDGSDCPECPDMVVIPSGAYAMGASAEEERQENLPSELRGRALPLTRITIARAFAVARTEVTRAQYAAFVAATGRTHAGGCIVYRRNPASGAFEWRRDPGASWDAPGFAQSDRDPVVCVSHADAGAYVQWLSDRTDQRYRLLSESEWEYAARAGARSPRWWNGGAGAACAHANVADRDAAQALDLAQTQGNIHPCSDRYAPTAPSASFAANGFGLHDMLGNVWEWTEDCWNANLTGRPGDAQVRHIGNCQQRAIRGGAWNDAPMVVRAGFRDWAEADSRSDVIGIRIAREIPSAPQISAGTPR